jgi:DNA polymerase III delta prime subunit
VEKLAKKGAKKGNGDASFIVDDDEDELYAFFENAGMRTSQHTDADVDDLGCGFDSGIDSQSSQEDAALDFRASDRLTNCILLQGPPGSGKTAAIFACAEELNFEVFELFPGMGKRGSKELKEAVGALGRNHMVSGGGSGGGANRSNGASGSNAFKALMGSTNAKASGSHQAKSDQMRGRMVIPDSSETEDSQPIVEEQETTPATNSTRPMSSTRQSLILIEEADVLFEDDRAFWTGVVDLVKQSKRPVILTCNGE